MKAGSFFPGQHYSSLYAMAADDCSLFFDLKDLTEKQQQDHKDNQELTAALQVALMAIGHDQDHLAMYDAFEEPGWQQTLLRYHEFFRSMTDQVIPLPKISYHPRHTFYESVAQYVEDRPDLTDVVNLYMTSGTNSAIHQQPSMLQVSRNVNSKKHFAENAPGFGLPVPDTMITTKGELHSNAVSAFFKQHNQEVMIKLMGLAGARNVAAVSSVEDCIDYVGEYQDSMIVLLQQKLPLDFYTEMTVDLFVSDEDIHIANTRKILFADGLWVGNLIGESVELTDQQIQTLIKVGEYARHHGYSSAIGSNCGVDFFLGKDGSVIVTEINARWTGGLFPAEMLKLIGERRDAVPFFDTVLIDKREAYLDFIERYLVGTYEGEFAIVPLGFGCYPVKIEGQDFFYTWQIVVGNLDAFKQVKQAELGDGALPTADIITL